MFEHTPIPCGTEYVTKDLIADTTDQNERAWGLAVECVSHDIDTGMPKQGSKPECVLVRGFNGNERYTLDEAIELYNSLDEEAIAKHLVPGERVIVPSLSSSGRVVCDMVPVKMLLHIDDDTLVDEVACEYQFETHVRVGTPGIQKADRPSAEQAKNGRKAFYQAVACLQGDGVGRDIRRGVELMEEAAKLGNSLAQYNLYLFYLGPERNRYTQEEAFGFLQSAAHQNLGPALKDLGEVYLSGVLGQEVNENRALSCYFQAVAVGEWSAIPLCVGLMIKTMSMGEEDAIALLKLGARKGDPECAEMLANLAR
ncbi:MAG: sel1 repeat family protein [Atopobiaceae bacterium]|nr:sel1 repeat family protein [Atopobiaceae bacterium]